MFRTEWGNIAHNVSTFCAHLQIHQNERYSLEISRIKYENDRHDGEHIMKDITLKYSGPSGERLRQWFMLSLASLSTFSTLWTWARSVDINQNHHDHPHPHHHHYHHHHHHHHHHEHHHQVFANIFKWVYRWVHGCIARRKAASKYEYDDDDDDDNDDDDD